MWQAGKVGLGTFIGFIIGTVAKIGCALTIVMTLLVMWAQHRFLDGLAWLQFAVPDHGSDNRRDLARIGFFFQHRRKCQDFRSFMKTRRPGQARLGEYVDVGWSKPRTCRERSGIAGNAVVCQDSLPDLSP